MVLGKFPVLGRPTVWMIVGQGPIALAVGAGEGCLDIFTLFCPFSPLSPSLWETAWYRLKYCLKGPLNPKQPTNQNQCLDAYTEQYFYISVGYIDKRNGIGEASPGDKNYQVPEYSPGFHKLGSSLPIVEFG